MFSFALKPSHAVWPEGSPADMHGRSLDGFDAASFRARSGFSQRRRYFEMV
jgi:hypothetical protein